MLEFFKGIRTDLREVHSRYLNCIVSTQRSGSTLMCRDITNSTNLGRIDEYFVAYMNRVRNKGSGVGPEYFYEICTGTPGNFNFKVMINQLDSLGAMVSDPVDASKGKPTDPTTDYARVAIERFIMRFAAVRVIFLRRHEPFAQAFSHIRAQRTGVYHHEAGGPRTSAPPNGATPSEGLDFVLAINREIQSIHEQETRFLKLAAETGLDVLEISYREVVGDYPGYLERIRDHFGIKAMTITPAARQMKKVVGDDVLQDAKAAYLKTLKLI